MTQQLNVWLCSQVLVSLLSCFLGWFLKGGFNFWISKEGTQFLELSTQQRLCGIQEKNRNPLGASMAHNGWHIKRIALVKKTNWYEIS